MLSQASFNIDLASFNHRCPNASFSTWVSLNQLPTCTDVYGGNSGKHCFKAKYYCHKSGPFLCKNQVTFGVLLSQSLPFITSIQRQHTSMYGSSLSYIFLLCHWTRKCICTNLLRGKYFTKIMKTEESMWVNAPFAQLFTRPVFFGMQMCHLPSLPHIYSSVFTFLRHIYEEKICANAFFFFVQWVMLSILSLC